MKIGIDISQLAYEKTGVANYLRALVQSMVQIDDQNEYVLFYSSLRKEFPMSNFQYQMSNKKVTIKKFRFPPTFLDLLWNKLHIIPIETFIGNVDVFISSDWTQPPTKRAKSVTILYDLIVYKFPEEMADVIVKTHKRRLKWVKKECNAILCISEATKNDAAELLGVSKDKLYVVYPG